MFAASTYIATFSIVVMISTLILKELLSPSHKQWTSILLSKRKYKLPAGPPGIPIFGNLLQFMNARKSGQLFPWVSKASPSTHYNIDSIVKPLI